MTKAFRETRFRYCTYHGEIYGMTKHSDLYYFVSEMKLTDCKGLLDIEPACQTMGSLIFSHS